MEIQQERRVRPRHNLHVEMLLIHNSHVMRAVSKNLSLSGAMLHEAIPLTYLRGVIDVVMIIHSRTKKKHVYLNFRAVALSGPLSRGRLTFIEDKDGAFDKLKTILDQLDTKVA